ncbi:MAG: flagellin [Leptospirales bacterium]
MKQKNGKTMIIQTNIDRINQNKINLAANHTENKSRVNGNVVNTNSTNKIVTDATKPTDKSEISVRGKMTTRLMSLRQARQNVTYGMNLLETADLALKSMQRILQKIRVLAVKSSNGTYTETDRQGFQVQVSQLIDEIDRISSQSEFNSMKLLQGDLARGSRLASMWIQMGPNMHERERVFLSTMTAGALRMRSYNGGILTISTAGLANDAIGVIDDALERVYQTRGDVKGYTIRFEEAIEKTDDEIELLEKSLEAEFEEPDIEKELKKNKQR